ncbi:MAG: nucleotidyltransferase substrate binding protein [Firmicutes bacterium]|nr:nucleotidyltransferase substrate binding protein [Bacillota bacterium]
MDDLAGAGSRLKSRIQTAIRALGTLREVIGREEPQPLERDAAIQRFEYTFEATWKAAMHFLHEVEGLEVASPKGVVRACREVGLLTSEEAREALTLADDRNLTVHTYNEALAKAIYSRLEAHARLMDVWLERMDRRLP